MKSNDIGKRVKINKPGIFQGMEGVIIEMKAMIRITNMGDWGFPLSEVDLANEPQIKTQVATISENGTTDKPKEVKAPKVVKKAKVKKVVNDKPKRAYNRKVNEQ